MLLLLISLFTHYDLLSCVNYEKAKFDESLLMKHHHQNFLEIKDFIKKAQHKFHEERSVLRLGDYEQESTRDDEFLDHSITNWWWDNTSSIEQLGRDTPQTFLFPLIRSRPSFPFFITPPPHTTYTTELNNRHLKWDEIFRDQIIFTRSSGSGLRTGLKVSSTPKNPSLPQPHLKTLMSRPKDQESSSPTIKPSKLHICTKPLHPKTTLFPHNSIRGYSSQPFGPTTTSITPNEELKKIWLREITTYTPVERWFKTLATQTRLTPSNAYTTNPAFQYGRTLSNAQALVPTKQLKNDSKDQPPVILRQGIPRSETPTEDRYRHPEYSIYRKQQGEVEYQMLRRTIHGQRRFSINTPKERFTRTKNVIRPKEKKKHREPTDPPNAMLQYYEQDNIEDEKFIKFIERTDESVRKTAQKDKTFYHHVKESLKQAESKKRAKRLKIKADLLRKIVEGSSYSDEEASLTKNLMQALQYVNRTFERDVARNNRDTMKRILR